VMMATTVAKRMTSGREDFWICVLIAFILCWGSFLRFAYNIFAGRRRA
jgi:hypothetical protein